MDNLFNNIYKGKKVLITGHTGFKGSWLALWLTKLGAEVIGYSIDIPSEPNHFELLNLKMTSVKGDVLDKNKLFEIIKEHNPEIIFHMAAQALVRRSYTIPAETFETNILGTINILESCRKLKTVKVIVNITSDKCYENKEDGKPYTEGDPMGGNDPYSASKGAAEIVSNSYRKSFFSLDEYGKTHTTLLANVRAGNVIGGGDWAQDRLIPDIIKSTVAGNGSVIRNPDSVRPWQHVLEPISGYLSLGAKLLNGEKEYADNWNFGPKEESILSVKKIIEHAQKYWGAIKIDLKTNADNLHEANILKLDSSKARSLLKWQSVWEYEDTISKTINWYKSYYENNIVLSEKDLKDYIENAKRLNIDWTKI
ncbi:MAG: CDP-glucose 4,6-dehydratase [Minisyncoccia bacterium]